MCEMVVDEGGRGEKLPSRCFCQGPPAALPHESTQLVLLRSVSERGLVAILRDKQST